MHGYKVIADENANPGKYGFRIIHDTEVSHFFSSEEQIVVREWMKALMKATIDRDFSSAYLSLMYGSCSCAHTFLQSLSYPPAIFPLFLWRLRKQ